MHNALAHWSDTPEWKTIDDKGLRHFVWDDDALADTLLMQYGAYPDAADICIDYAELLSEATLAIACRIDKAAPIPMDVLEHPNLSYLTQHGLRRHDTVRAGLDYAGFFVGDAGNIFDLMCFWNLRAADIRLQYIDPAHLQRYAVIRPECERTFASWLAHLDEHRRNLAVWSRTEIIDDAVKLVSGQRVIACLTDGQPLWNGGNVRPPTMTLGEASSWASSEQGKPKVSFALNAKPFCADTWFYTQHLVASVTLYGGDSEHSFHPPSCRNGTSSSRVTCTFITESCILRPLPAKGHPADRA